MLTAYSIRNGSLCHKVNQVIGQTPQTFCHPEKHPKKLKDVGPSHTFVYCTEENGGNIRFEANVTHNAYEDFLLSESALYRGDYTIGDLEPGVRRRLDARVLSLEGYVLFRHGLQVVS